MKSITYAYGLDGNVMDKSVISPAGTWGPEEIQSYGTSAPTGQPIEQKKRSKPTSNRIAAALLPLGEHVKRVAVSAAAPFSGLFSSSKPIWKVPKPERAVFQPIVAREDARPEEPIAERENAEPGEPRWSFAQGDDDELMGKTRNTSLHTIAIGYAKDGAALGQSHRSRNTATYRPDSVDSWNYVDIHPDTAARPNSYWPVATALRPSPASGFEAVRSDANEAALDSPADASSPFSGLPGLRQPVRRDPRMSALGAGWSTASGTTFDTEPSTAADEQPSVLNSRQSALGGVSPRGIASGTTFDSGTASNVYDDPASVSNPPMSALGGGSSTASSTTRGSSPTSSVYDDQSSVSSLSWRSNLLRDYMDRDSTTEQFVSRFSRDTSTIGSTNWLGHGDEHALFEPNESVADHAPDRASKSLSSIYDLYGADSAARPQSKRASEPEPAKRSHWSADSDISTHLTQSASDTSPGAVSADAREQPPVTPLPAWI